MTTFEQERDAALASANRLIKTWSSMTEAQWNKRGERTEAAKRRASALRSEAKQHALDCLADALVIAFPQLELL
jgi:hypothetical protein